MHSGPRVPRELPSLRDSFDSMRHTAHGYWLEEAGGVEPAEPLSGERVADVVVVGGGYTGMWAAWHLKRLEPEARVTLLEADVCGHGPSGRNGGFCNVMWFSLPNMRERWGAAAALAVTRASSEAVAGIEAFCAEQGVDAWFRRGGYLQVSTAAAHDGAWEPALAACRELGAAGADAAAQGGTAAANPCGSSVGPEGATGRRGGAEPVRELSSAEVAARCASPAFRGGALYPDAATVQPARLGLGLRERLRGAGVEIYEHSPVRRLLALPRGTAAVPGAGDSRRAARGTARCGAQAGGGVEARTAGGRVRAGAAVIAIGGAAKAPGAPLRSALTVSSSHIVLTEPVPEALEEIGWTGGECITDSRALIDYFRTTPDGRIAFGWGGGRIALGGRLQGRAELDPEVVAQAAARLYDYFPVLADAGSGPADRGGRGPARLTHAWGGPIDVSPTHLPLVVPLPGGDAFAAAGYTGNGVGPSYMVGRALASLALDRRDEHSRLAFVDPAPRRVPPEPLHWLGGEAIRRALIDREDAELAGRAPNPLSSLVSRIPDLIGFHIGR
jgi:glycine/D-amino acid oxidase-like deaminating enzyme